ncbi:MAG: acyl carrier protein [Candidatus Omnitrophica bacterium CG07_land_8_20_14_0_80_42_15]|uniref:Acyl carrier protein n=1 Tax=Candidatus Aquitaenariimonas noxiae TaxID=1974741 RepID=A0A2J0L2N2_9BACT|nr:MAG: acyl carrier protein [Candidatus Omnitrophica bacterium CG07_land_8_20_14_0_80_42_15]
MEVRDKLNRIFQEVFKDSVIQIKPETTANNIDGWDSFSHITLIVAIETRFNIKFTQKELLGFRNVGDLIKSIESKIAP